MSKSLLEVNIEHLIQFLRNRSNRARARHEKMSEQQRSFMQLGELADALDAAVDVLEARLQAARGDK